MAFVKKRANNRYGAKKSNGLSWDHWVMPITAGSHVRAVASGRVILADWLKGYGLVIIDHGDGYMSLYGYNQSIMVSEGQWIQVAPALPQWKYRQPTTGRLIFWLEKIPNH